MLTLENSYKSLIQHFRISVAMATNQNKAEQQWPIAIIDIRESN